MPSTDTDRGQARPRPPMNRRRFFRRSLAAGASGLLAAFGLTGRGNRPDQAAPRPSQDFPPSSRELAG